MGIEREQTGIKHEEMVALAWSLGVARTNPILLSCSLQVGQTPKRPLNRKFGKELHDLSGRMSQQRKMVCAVLLHATTAKVIPLSHPQLPSLAATYGCHQTHGTYPPCSEPFLFPQDSKSTSSARADTGMQTPQTGTGIIAPGSFSTGC